MTLSELCPITQKTFLTDKLVSFWIKSPKIAEKSMPGQFLHIRCGGDTLLRRPISICEIENNLIRFVFEVKGKGTALLAEYSEGDSLDVLGPLGKGFEVSDGRALLIGGGIGVFPLLQLSRLLSRPIALLGFRSAAHISLESRFREFCKETVIATDDGSFGRHGLVTDIAKEYIDDVDIVYACGPTPMLRAVQTLAASHGKRAQLSLEERMGCGVGGCMTCVCGLKDGNYAAVCKNGPVFEAEEVVI